MFFFAEVLVRFTQAKFNVRESKNEYVEVCITLNDGVPLNSSLGEANFTITIHLMPIMVSVYIVQVNQKFFDF